MEGNPTRELSMEALKARLQRCVDCDKQCAFHAERTQDIQDVEDKVLKHSKAIGWLRGGFTLVLLLISTLILIGSVGYRKAADAQQVAAVNLNTLDIYRVGKDLTESKLASLRYDFDKYKYMNDSAIASLTAKLGEVSSAQESNHQEIMSAIKELKK